VVVRVSDEGPGIPPEERDTVFDVFYRVRAGDKQAAGTGLGLSICRGLVEGHSGRIEALPGPGERGTTIAFWFPVQPVPAIASPDEDEREPQEGSRPL
jgi:two-component system sensor histidine kinase KdpD